MNPLSRALATVVAVLALAAALFFGLIVLALVVGIGLLFWLGIRLRLWWMRRHIPPHDTGPASTPQKGAVIDAEYTVVSRHKD
ncbi:MAG: hypothetical protein IID60_00300 [Proteobacteria bacterium]|nr:hypothetical protein [Pseudomonadota bacterium]